MNKGSFGSVFSQPHKKKYELEASPSRTQIIRSIITQRKKVVEWVKLAEKTNYSKQELYILIQLKNFEIPIDIFSSKLSPLEALTSYLKDYEKLNFHEIGLLLNRNERNLWHSYKKSNFEVGIEKIPANIFGDRRLSILEHVVCLLQKKFSTKEIAEKLKKDPSTIWSVQARIKEKIPESEIQSIQHNAIQLEVLEKLRKLTEEISKKAKLPKKAVLKEMLFHSWKDFVPAEIFRKLSPLQAIVQYYHTELGLTFQEISKITNRDPRTIWTTWKQVGKIKVDITIEGLLIPIRAISSRKLSTLEAIVVHCKILGYSFNEIAELLSCSYKTVWTCNFRAKMKQKGAT